MSFWCLQFPPKNEQKQAKMGFQSSKVEFVHSFFGGNIGLEKSFRLFLTFTYQMLEQKEKLEVLISSMYLIQIFETSRAEY